MNKETDLMLESLKANGTHEMDLPYIEVKGDSVTIDGSLNVDDLRIIVSELEKQKPRTKTEFVKCEFEQVYLAAKAVFDGEELFVGFVDHSGEPTGEYSEVVDQQRAARNYQHLYRKVETEIDERQEFIDTYKNLASVGMPLAIGDWAGILFDSGKFKLVE
jgi:hypothetical protein